VCRRGGVQRLRWKKTRNHWPRRRLHGAFQQQALWHQPNSKSNSGFHHKARSPRDENPPFPGVWSAQCQERPPKPHRHVPPATELHSCAPPFMYKRLPTYDQALPPLKASPPPSSSPQSRLRIFVTVWMSSSSTFLTSSTGSSNAVTSTSFVKFRFWWVFLCT